MQKATFATNIPHFSHTYICILCRKQIIYHQFNYLHYVSVFTERFKYNHQITFCRGDYRLDLL